MNLENACIQINTRKSKKAPGGRNRLGDPSEDTDSEKFTFKGSEDCLFLDIYASASAFEPNAKPLPVVVWFYGGAYAFGAKDQFLLLYSGKALIEASNYGAIFVTGNYRLGAFGWLAGSYIEKEGLPNAGLYDQRLLLEWVQEYIDRVKGDKNRVSARGESAGAGPSVGGKWIKTIPTLAFSQVKRWNGIKSAIVSHCANEAEHFTPPDVKDEKTFNDFLAIFLPGLKTQQDAIKKQYDCQNRFSGNYSLCLRAIIQDASFTCNTRDFIQSYNNQTYAMNYGFPDDNLAYHASDLVASFTNYEPQAIFMLTKLGMKPLAEAKWASKLWSVKHSRWAPA
ncbi:hypothetical protein CEP54_012650 [Fusarium duplospermum]|uniref:Carboxylesterase type B domain-containing protein n=1 Tax=Fusarium duplospermum TaxID=1325734 RepID=A0A428P7G6_9HYPO|nr:hypothetical protein CEP54_012650 [Fusarium duplospermum]